MTDEFSAMEQAALDAMTKNEPMEVADTTSEEATETAAPAATPEAPAPAAAQSDDKPKPPEGYVPHGAMHEARERAKAAEAERDALKAEMAAMKAPKAPEAAPDEMPDPILDPKGFATWIKGLSEAQAKRVEEYEAQQRQTAAQQERVSTATRLEAEFAGRTPDYGPAMAHLAAGRRAELALQGWDEAQVAEIMRHDANAIFDNATRMGRNPAEMLYELAKHRGWAAKPASGEGDKIVALAKAAEATASLATTAGEAQAGGLTMKQLSEMSEAELHDLEAKDPKAFKRAMGG